jgi:hypothetical protein
MRVNAADTHVVWSRSLTLDKRASHPACDIDPWFFFDWAQWDNCATSMAVTQEGNVIVAGFGLNGLTNRDIWVMKFDTAGNRLWSTTYLNGGPFDDVAFDVAVAQDRTIYVAGLTESEDNMYDFLVLRLADTGDVLNSYTYNGVPEGDDFATRLVLDETTPQNVYVTGASEHALRGFQMMTQKLSHDLVPLWGHDGAKFGWAGDDFGYDITYNKCRAYVTGTVSGDIRLVCYSNSNVAGGETLWTFAYGLPDHLQDWGACLHVVDTDHIYLAGQCDRIDSTYNWMSMFTARLRTSPGGVHEAGSVAARRFTLMPNPFPGRGVLRLEVPGRPVCEVVVFDAIGRRRASVVRSIELQDRRSVPLDVRNLGPGILVLRIHTRDGAELARFKVVVP